jgi:hypothetical protein
VLNREKNNYSHGKKKKIKQKINQRIENKQHLPPHTLNPKYLGFDDFAFLVEPPAFFEAYRTDAAFDRHAVCPINNTI